MWKWIFGAGHDVYIKSLVEQNASLSREIQALKEKVSGLEPLHAQLEFQRSLASTLQQKVEGFDRTNTILHSECNNKTEQIQVLTNKLTLESMRVEKQTSLLQELKRIIDSGE